MKTDQTSRCHAAITSHRNPFRSRKLPARQPGLRCFHPFVRCACLVLALQLIGGSLLAQTISVTKALGPGTPDPIPAGQDFDYVIGYTFSSTTADFYSAVVTDTLPAGVVYAGSFTPSAHVVSVTTPATNSGGTVTFNLVSPLLAGSSGTLKIRVRFPLGTTANGTSASNTATGSGRFGSASGPVISGTSGPVVLTASAGCNWTLCQLQPSSDGASPTP